MGALPNDVNLVLPMLTYLPRDIVNLSVCSGVQSTTPLLLTKPTRSQLERPMEP